MDFTKFFSLCQEEVLKKFTPKKELSFQLASTYDAIGDDLLTYFSPDSNFSSFSSDDWLRFEEIERRIRKKAELVRSCSSYPEFLITENEKRLHRIMFCKDRLCPMCAWRRSLKIFGQVSDLVNHLQLEYRFVFLTLTVVSVKSSLLESTINRMQNAWRKIVKSSFYTQAYKGSIRVLEITYNKGSKTFHPHYHVTLAVNPSYFSSKFYRSQEEWLSVWQDAYDDSSITQVDIRSFKKKAGSVDWNDAVAEVSKYTVKLAEFPPEAVYPLFITLYNRHLVVFSGIFLKARKELNHDDPVDGDLINIHPVNNIYVQGLIVKYHWIAGVGYVHHSIRETIPSDFF